MSRLVARNLRFQIECLIITFETAGDGPRTVGFFRGVENFQAVFVACLNVFGTKSLVARLHDGFHAELRGAQAVLNFCRLVAWIPLFGNYNIQDSVDCIFG